MQKGRRPETRKFEEIKAFSRKHTVFLQKCKKNSVFFSNIIKNLDIFVIFIYIVICCLYKGENVIPQTCIYAKNR